MSAAGNFSGTAIGAGIDRREPDLPFEVLADEILRRLDGILRGLAEATSIRRPPWPPRPVPCAAGRARAPARRGAERRCVPPYPGMMPRFTSGWPRNNPGPTTRAWHDIESSAPPPSHRTVQRRDDRLLQVRDDVQHGVAAEAHRLGVLRRLRRGEFVDIRACQSAVETRQDDPLHGGVGPTLSKTSRNSAIVRARSAFLTSGRRTATHGDPRVLRHRHVAVEARSFSPGCNSGSRTRGSAPRRTCRSAARGPRPSVSARSTRPVEKPRALRVIQSRSEASQIFCSTTYRSGRARPPASGRGSGARCRGRTRSTGASNDRARASGPASRRSPRGEPEFPPCASFIRSRQWMLRRFPSSDP